MLVVNSYSISKLARDAGVSLPVARDCAARGLLRPVERTASGYNIYGARTSVGLLFVRAALEARMGLPKQLTTMAGAIRPSAATENSRAQSR